MRICDKCSSKDNVKEIVVKVEDVVHGSPFTKDIIWTGSLSGLTPRPYHNCEKVLELCPDCLDTFTQAMMKFMANNV